MPLLDTRPPKRSKAIFPEGPSPLGVFMTILHMNLFDFCFAATRIGHNAGFEFMGWKKG